MLNGPVLNHEVLVIAIAVSIIFYGAILSLFAWGWGSIESERQWRKRLTQSHGF